MLAWIVALLSSTSIEQEPKEVVEDVLIGDCRGVCVRVCWAPTPALPAEVAVADVRFIGKDRLDAAILWPLLSFSFVEIPFNWMGADVSF